MIELKTNLENFEKYVDELAAVGTNLKGQQLLRDAAADIRSLKMEVLKLEATLASLGNALFELIEPNLNQLFLERPSRVDVMTMRSVVHDMVTDGAILGNCAEVTLVNGVD